MNFLDKDGSIVFDVRVVPVRIASPPVDGAANAELIKLFAKKFRVAKSDITIVSGETSKNKRIKIANLSQSEFDEVTK